MTNTNNIPTVAEQVDLATRALAALGGAVEIDGRRYTVSRFHYELRFTQTGGLHRGEVARTAHVACLRSDVAKAQTLPTMFQDRDLAAKCECIVAAVMS